LFIIERGSIVAVLRSKEQDPGVLLSIVDEMVSGTTDEHCCVASAAS